MNNISPIFIVGMPRSGTTLLSSILSAHPNITISPESHFFVHYLKYYHLDISTLDNFEIFWEDFSQSKYFSNFKLDPNDIKSHIFSSNTICFKAIFSTLLSEYAKKMDKQRWGEKTPNHYRNVDTLFEWYPHARVIWMVRDPRAVLASLESVPWSDKSTKDSAYKWRDCMLRFEREWALDKRIQITRYETLVENPESTIQDLCKFIGEEYSSLMLNNRSNITSPVIDRTKWTKDHFERSLQPITKPSVEKWRSTFSTHQVTEIENITRAFMMKYSYKPISSPLIYQSLVSAFNLFVYKLKNRIVKITS